MKVLVCGDRNWSDSKKIIDRISSLPQGTTILTGACRGADRIATEEARALHYEVIEFPADWDAHGRAAGPIRNREMLDQKPDLVIAFHSNLAASKGTADTVCEAKRRGIPVEVIT
jgi:YspA, cpYpsA-related SLOG family